MPNALAYIVLFGSPLLIIVLFRVLPRPHAIIASVICAYLLLPTEPQIDLPALPTINKTNLPIVTVLILCMLSVSAEARRRRFATAQNDDGPSYLPGWLPRARTIRIMLAVLAAGLCFTVLMNRDPVPVGGGFLPGMRLYDLLSLIQNTGLVLMPFVIGRKFLADPGSHRALLLLLALAGFAYSFPVLLEVRLSPQLNTWIYGFFPHSFAQHMRSGGFRPVVFLSHGLWLAIFMAMAALAVLGCWRARRDSSGIEWIFLALWMSLVLFLMHSLGAFLIYLALAPIALFLPQRLQLLAAGLIVGLALSYPLLRSAGIFPVDQVSDLAARINPQRADSLRFRFNNETDLLEKWQNRPLFGWGTWGRNFIYHEITGLKLTTVDSQWVILLTSLGLFGFFGQFGLLAMPVVILSLRRARTPLVPETTALCLVLAANFVDMMVNATLTSVTWLIAGALAGRLETIRAVDAPAPRQEARRQWNTEPPPQAATGLTRYTRQTVRHPTRSSRVSRTGKGRP